MREFSIKHPDRTDIIKDYTTEAAKTVYDGSLDFVFIDADHGYEGCLRDIKAWDSKVRDGGIVFGHDIHFPTVQKAVTKLVEC
jgi:predicted O-methyltransferase YrrM